MCCNQPRREGGEEREEREREKRAEGQEKRREVRAQNEREVLCIRSIQLSGD